MSAVRDIDKRQPSARLEPTAAGFWPVSVSTWTLAVGHILPSGDASLSPREGTAAWALRMCPPAPPGAQGRRSDFPTSAVRRQEQPGPRRRLQLSGPSAFRGPLLPPAGQVQAGSGCPLPALSSGAPQLRWALVLTAPSRVLPSPDTLWSAQETAFRGLLAPRDR